MNTESGERGSAEGADVNKAAVNECIKYAESIEHSQDLSSNEWRIIILAKEVQALRQQLPRKSQRAAVSATHAQEQK